ncbi:UNVERIFIED_ORG: hypothetical protein QOE_2985 [Clostridioides difficile F501]
MRRAHAGRTAGDVQHRFGERCLAGAVLAHQHNVSHVFGSRSCHVDHQLSCCVAHAVVVSAKARTTVEPNLRTSNAILKP